MRRERRVFGAAWLGFVGALALVACGSESSSPQTIEDGVPEQRSVDLVLSKATGDFDAVPVGTSSVNSVEFKVVNLGNATSGPLSVSVTPPFWGTGCNTMKLPPNGLCTVKVVFAPVTVGEVAGTLSFSATPGGSLSVTLTGRGIAAALSFTPPDASLPGLSVGDSAAGVLVLSNTGTGPANALALTASDGDLALDASTTTCGPSLDAGAACAVGYVFTAKTKGAKTVELRATATGASATASIGVDVADPPSLIVTPSSAPGTTRLGADSAEFTLTIRNVGGMPTGPLTMATDGRDAANFRITSNTCISLASQAQCTVGVVFNAATVGAKTAKLTVTDSTDTRVTASAELSGAASEVDWFIKGGPDLGSVELGKASAPVVFTIPNLGSGLSVSTDNDEFVITSDNCTGKELAPGPTCTVAVSFRPSALGVRTATLIAKGAAGTAMLTLTGRGLPLVDGGPRLAPATWDFGVVAVGAASASKTFTVTTWGPSSLDPPKVAITGAAAASFVATSECNAPLAVGATCTVTVVFAPRLNGPMAVTLSLTSGTYIASATLSGTGQPSSSISPE